MIAGFFDFRVFGKDCQKIVWIVDEGTPCVDLVGNRVLNGEKYLKKWWKTKNQNETKIERLNLVIKRRLKTSRFF